MLLVGISSLLIAMIVSWAVTPVVIRLAPWLGALDLPGGRKAHAQPVPRIGGLAVFAGFAAGLAFGAFASGVLLTVHEGSIYWRGMAIAATGLLAVGLLDDVRGLSYRWKFAAQIAAALYVWFCGFRIEILTNPFGPEPLYLDAWLSVPLTVLWIVAITNAVNLIDGLDGLASGMALISTTAMAVIAFAGGHLGMTAACVALAGSLLGFLHYNFNPARIFLGDSGSLFLGFILAVVSVRGSTKGPATVAILVPLLVLGLPLFDTTVAVARRVYRLGETGRRNGRGSLGHVVRNIHEIFQPDRGHVHHRLIDLGFSHRNAVLALYLVGVVLALAAFVLVLVKSGWIALLLAAALATVLAAFFLLVYFRFRRGETLRETEQPSVVKSQFEPAEDSFPTSPGNEAQSR